MAKTRTLPTTLKEYEEELKKARKKERERRDYRMVLKSTITTLLAVAAIAILVATLLLPVLQIYGTSMQPTLADGDIVVSLKNAEFNRQDIVAFYYNNKILVKRVIANAGEWVDIDKDGNVTVDGVPLNEPYLIDKDLGDTDITYPYQVPDGRIFVMGDHRSVSVDSRSSTVGCVAQEQIVGKLTFRIWPMDKFGSIT
ncbi:MAG: signal peptidase I [Blautia sp.]|nr:signal peptidase I [Blautia sp.]